MSSIRAKQVKLANKGDILIAGDNGVGTTLAKGTQGMHLTVGAETVSYQYVNKLLHTEGTSTLEIDRDVSASSGEKLLVKSFSGKSQITATNTSGTGDVNIVLKPQDNGQVIIDSVGNSSIKAGDDEILYLSSGDATTTNANGSNLVLSGGAGNGTGRIGLVVASSGYTLPNDAPNETFTTKGYVSSAVASVTRTEFRDQVTITTPSANYEITLTHTPIGSVDVLFNGMALDSGDFTISGNVVTLVDSQVGYTVEVDDVLQVRYEYNV